MSFGGQNTRKGIIDEGRRRAQQGAKEGSTNVFQHTIWCLAPDCSYSTKEQDHWDGIYSFIKHLEMMEYNEGELPPEKANEIVHPTMKFLEAVGLTSKHYKKDKDEWLKQQEQQKQPAALSDEKYKELLEAGHLRFYPQNDYQWHLWQAASIAQGGPQHPDDVAPKRKWSK